MRSEFIIFPSPSLCQYLGFLQAGKDFSIEQLVPEFPIEWFVVPIFPGAAWFDEQILDIELSQPFQDCLCSKLRSIVGSYVSWEVFFEELLSEYFNHILSFEYFPDHQHQVFYAEFID